MEREQRRPGRPRKWSSNAERMRAYRARQRERAARLVDPADAPAALAENRQLRERVVQLEEERDRLWAQVLRLQEELRVLQRACVSEASLRQPADAKSPPLPRAQRRRLERERARNERRRT